jgi:type I restriction enzyme M protein
MEACLLICSNNKPADRQGKILFINAVSEVKAQKTISILEEKHIQKIFSAYKKYKNIEGFAKIVDAKKILSSGNASLNISFYVSNGNGNSKKQTLPEIYSSWEKKSNRLRKSIKILLDDLHNEDK